jgi:hypothetical protein
MIRALPSLSLAAALTLGVAARAHAQRLEGTASVQQLTYKYKDDVGRDRLRGMMLGASGSVSFGIVRLGLSGFTGQLTGGTSLSNRSLRGTAINLGFRPSPSLEVGVEAQARREAVDTAIVLQRLLGAYTRLTADFGTTGLQGTGELGFFPVRSATNIDPANAALRAGIGVRYAPYTSAVMVELAYRMFRLDHRSTTGAMRLEQDESLVLSLGLRR